MEPHEIKRFIVKPQPGDIVKVYHGTEGRAGISFGKVIKTDIDDDWDEKQGKVEIVVLDPLQRQYELSDCNYCLNETRVSYEGQPTKFKQKIITPAHDEKTPEQALEHAARVCGMTSEDYLKFIKTKYALK